MAAATAAANSVEAKFTRSFPSHPRRSTVAPKKLSKNSPKIPAPNPVSAAAAPGCIAHPPAAATSAPATTPAPDPNTVTAPSVPGATRRIPTINTGPPPNACPISEDTVSAAASTSAARHIVFIIRIDPPVSIHRVSPLKIHAAHGEAQTPATERFAITCAAVLPRRPSARPARTFRCRPALVAKNVSRNNSSSGASPDRTTDTVHVPVQKVISKQIIPPNAAPPTVAARNFSTANANTALSTKTSTTKTGNRTPILAAARTTSTLNPTSSSPTTPTSTRDCSRSRASGIAFLHPVSPSMLPTSSPNVAPLICNQPVLACSGISLPRSRPEHAGTHVGRQNQAANHRCFANSAFTISLTSCTSSRKPAARIHCRATSSAVS